MSKQFKPPQITLSQAATGFFYTLNARSLSENTILDYQNSIGKFQLFMERDCAVAEITPKHIEGFLISQRNGRTKKPLTNKTLLNYYIGLSALWSWIVHERYTEENVVRFVPAPQAEQREIIPFTKDEIKSMLNVLGRSRVYQRAGHRPSDHAIPLPERNRALILTLIDTGLRADELCQARIQDLDQRNSRIHVMGKGAKERHVPFSGQTGQAIFRYLTTRPPGTLPGASLFVTKDNRSIERRRLLHLLQDIGQRAGVIDVTVHRFRHTFAIQYLRNGGDPYTLQKLLGHSTLEMVKRYLAIAQIDLDNAHRRASPVDNWRL